MATRACPARHWSVHAFWVCFRCRGEWLMTHSSCKGFINGRCKKNVQREETNSRTTEKSLFNQIQKCVPWACFPFKYGVNQMQRYTSRHWHWQWHTHTRSTHTDQWQVNSSKDSFSNQLTSQHDSSSPLIFLHFVIIKYTTAHTQTDTEKF